MPPGSRTVDLYLDALFAWRLQYGELQVAVRAGVNALDPLDRLPATDRGTRPFERRRIDASCLPPLLAVVSRPSSG
jgi:hypothetical protein